MKALFLHLHGSRRDIHGHVWRHFHFKSARRENDSNHVLTANATRTCKHSPKSGRTRLRRNECVMEPPANCNCALSTFVNMHMRRTSHWQLPLYLDFLRTKTCQRKLDWFKEQEVKLDPVSGEGSICSCSLNYVSGLLLDRNFLCSFFVFFQMTTALLCLHPLTCCKKIWQYSRSPCVD